MKISNSKIFLICCVAFILGIAIASFLPIFILEKDLYIFSSVVLFFTLSIIFWSNEKIKLIGLVGLFLFLAIWRFAFFLPIDMPDKIWHYNGKEIEFTGIVSDETDLSGTSQKITIEVEKFNDYNIKGKVLLTTDYYPIYQYGDELKIFCELSTPEKIEDFAYDRYLARFEIFSTCFYPQIAKVNSDQGNWFYGKILKIKNRVRGALIRGSREPYTSLIGAMVLGDKKDIPDDLKLLFAQAGISHMMAISGMHIGILVIILMWSLIYLGLNRRQAFYFIIIFLLIYLLIIGMPASAMRACLMGFLVLWAMYLGRLNKMINSLVLVAAILLFLNPRIFRDDIGFQLSFLAVLGIVILFPKLENWSEKRRVPKLFGLRDIFFVTIAAQIFTAPIIMYSFSQFSVIAPLTNLLVIWTLPFLLIFSIVAIIFSLIFPSLAFIFFLPSEIIFMYIIKVCEVLTIVSFSNINF